MPNSFNKMKLEPPVFMSFSVLFFLGASLCLQVPALAQEKSWDELNREAIGFQEKGQYPEAIGVEEHALKVALSGQERPSIIESLQNLTSSYIALDKYNKAELLLKNAIRISEETFGSSDHRTTLCYFRLFNLYIKTFALEQDELAKLKLMNAIQMLSERVGIEIQSIEKQDFESTDAILFIHGFMGDPNITWRKGKVYWPSIMKEDQNIINNHIQVTTMTFPTTLLANKITLEELTQYVKDQLGILTSTKQNIYIVAHSMGGIVALSALASLYETDKFMFRKVKCIILFAVPFRGSGLSFGLTRFLSLNNTQIKDFSQVDQNSYLQNLDARWRNILNERDINGDLFPRIYTAYEKKRTFMILKPVKLNALFPSRDGEPFAFYKNHFDIVKPLSKDDLLHTWTIDKISKVFHEIRQNPYVGSLKTLHQNARSGKLATPRSLDNYVRFYFGSNLQTAPNILKAFFVTPPPKLNLNIRNTSDSILASMDYIDKNNTLIARIADNQWSVANDIFDRNFDTHRIEIIDKHFGCPILQAQFIGDVFTLNGIFYSENGDTWSATTNGTIHNGDIQCPTPWFKYPSRENPGELNLEELFNPAILLTRSDYSKKQNSR